MRKSSLAAAVLCVCMLASWLPVYAQTDPGYKIGDRVEADPTAVPDGPNKQWHKATVIGFVVGGYAVLLDGEHPRRAVVINYKADSSRRINEKRLDVPAGCPKDPKTPAEWDAVGPCWDAAAERGVQQNAAPNVQAAPKVAARPPVAPQRAQTKTVAEYEAEAAAYEAEAARILAGRGQQPAAQPRNPAQNGQQPGAVKTVAQAPHAGEFKVNDRVEVDETHSDHGPGKVWRKATVVGVTHSGGQPSYAVVIDTPPGTQVHESGVGSDDRWIRPIQGADRNPNPVMHAGGTCPTSTSDAGETGLARTFHRIIREKTDRSDAPGDARQTVTFQSFRVGGPIPYDAVRDAYPGANQGQANYPVRATYTVCYEHTRQLEFWRFDNQEFRCYQQGNFWNCTPMVTQAKDEHHWFGPRR